MNILMVTNTYAPHVGGVARSVETFARAYRDAGHRVLADRVWAVLESGRCVRLGAS